MKTTREATNRSWHLVNVMTLAAMYNMNGRRQASMMIKTILEDYAKSNRSWRCCMSGLIQRIALRISLYINLSYV